MKKKKCIAICSSVSFYKDLFAIEKELKKKEFVVKLPKTAQKMKKIGNFDVEGHKTWYKDASQYYIKTALIKDHFKKIVSSDAILVVNLTKNGISGYIGGNTLMEMTIAFYCKKPIYILNNIAEDLAIKEEIYGMQPIFLDGQIENIH